MSDRRFDRGRAASLTVARKEIVDTLRDRRTILVTLVSAALAGPIFLLLIFNLFAQQADRARELTLAVRGAEHAPALIAFLERQQVTITPAPDDFEAKIRGGDLDVVLIVEPKFDEDVEEGTRRDGTPRLRPLAGSRALVDRPGRDAAARLQPRSGAQTRLLLRGIAPEVGNPLNVETVESRDTAAVGRARAVPGRVLRPVRRGDGRHGGRARHDGRRARARRRSNRC